MQVRSSPMTQAMRCIGPSLSLSLHRKFPGAPVNSFTDGAGLSSGIASSRLKSESCPHSSGDCLGDRESCLLFVSLLLSQLVEFMWSVFVFHLSPLPGELERHFVVFVSSGNQDFPYSSDFKSWGFQKTSEYETSDKPAEAGNAIMLAGLISPSETARHLPCL